MVECFCLSVFLFLFLSLSLSFAIYLQSYLGNVHFFNILPWKCASSHNGVHFFDISTSKSGPTMVCFVRFDFEICFAPLRRALFQHLNGPRMVCFVHFDLEMCFAPQRRALFQHLNFQKWSENGVLCTF